ncbi:MAG: SURF1 family protein [Pseudolabrys sp.]
MNVRYPGERRVGWLTPTLFTIASLAILIGLGVWQLERKAWKEALIARLDARIAAPATVGVPPRDQWASLDPQQMEYRRVTVPVEFLHDQEALVYTAGSALRPDVKGAGYWVFTPARLPGGSTVIVNRGFVPLDHKDPATRREGQVSGPVDIVGLLRWPDERGTFTPNDEPANNVWYVRDPSVIGPAKKWGNVAPFFIDMESPLPPGGLPNAARAVLKLSDNHLQYALTWFGLALTLAGVYLAWMIRRFRG